jgi:hypothetical protein
MRCLLEISICRPAGANPARPGVSPPEPVVSLATVSVTGSAKRRHANVWAVVDVASKTISFRMPSVLFSVKAMAASP